MNLDIFKGIGVVKLILLLHFTFAPKCLATVTFRFRYRSDGPKSNGSEVLVYSKIVEWVSDMQFLAIVIMSLYLDFL